MRPFGRTDFDAAFTPGTTFQCPVRGRIRVRQVEVGDLVLPSGKVVACDPSSLEWSSDTIPLTRTAPTGNHPVILSLMAVGEETVVDQRVACAMVRFTTAKPVTWEMAVRPGEDASSLAVGKFFGYGVDAGMGCFIDADPLQALSKEGSRQFYEHRILGEMHKGGEYRDWAIIVVDQKTGGNLVVFSSGYGDGAYASYWGVGATGELCCLVTDFAILVEYLQGRSTFRLHEWLGKAIAHPDLSRIGLTVRLVPLDAPPHHRLEVQMEGGYCKSVIINAGKEYSSDGLGYGEFRGVGAYDFRFDEPLQPDTQITLEYGLGVRALECVAK